VPELKKYLTDVSQECNDAISRGEGIIIEGSQGFGISLSPIPSSQRISLPHWRPMWA
jgi:hypothetical protein